jgi:hypothetical protein
MVVHHVRSRDRTFRWPKCCGEFQDLYFLSWKTGPCQFHSFVAYRLNVRGRTGTMGMSTNLELRQDYESESFPPVVLLRIT